MRILICEDELIVAEYIKETCEEQGFQVVGMASSREEAILLITIEKPDIALLDINMDERFSGIKIAEHIRKLGLRTEFLYITAFTDAETLEAAISTQPQGYLVKPLDKSTLIANLLLTGFKTNHRSQKKEDEYIVITTDSGERKINLTALKYAQSDGNYCDLFFSNGSKVTERISMTALTESMSGKLLRIHKSYLVNPDYVVRFTSVKAFLENGIQLPIGRKFKDNIRSFLCSGNDSIEQH